MMPFLLLSLVSGDDKMDIQNDESLDSGDI